MNLAFNYGSKKELIDAVKNIVRQRIVPEEINEQTIQNNLYSPGVPDVDLLVRPGGEKRLSNFLLWQCANSMFFFTDTYWPSLGEDEIRRAVKEYEEKMSG